MTLAPLGKILIITGAAIIVLGVAFLFIDKIPLIGKLPGDILVKRQNFTLYFPLATSIIFSIIISLILLVINYFRR
jgi:hypothetical protein